MPLYSQRHRQTQQTRRLGESLCNVRYGSRLFMATTRKSSNHRFIRREFSAERGPIEYFDTAGSGPAVILLPGAQGTGLMFWKQMAALESKYRLISITYPGGTQADRVADELAALTDHLQVGAAVWVGSSLGGYLAQIVAARHPRICSGLVLGNTFISAHREIAAFPTLEAIESLPAENVVAGTRRNAQAISDPALAELRETLLDHVGGQQSAENFKQRLLCLLAHRPAPAAPLPPERILLIHSDDDPVIQQATFAQLQSRYASSDLVTFHGGNHYPYLLCADEYSQRLDRFSSRMDV
jgi:pimeloyl-ACP methyl ester carboxylesterase